MAYNTYMFVCYWCIWRALYLLKKVPCWLYLFFHSRCLPEKPHLAIGHHSIHYLYVWSQSIHNEGHFTYRTVYLVGHIPSSIQGILLKHHIYLSPTMLNSTCKFGRYWSIMKGTLLQVQCSFLHVTLLLFKWFSWNSICGTGTMYIEHQPPSPTIHVSMVMIGL